MPLKALETEFAIDSTAFGTQSFYRHFSAKYGKEQVVREFIKLHAVMGTQTNVVNAAKVTGRETGAPVLLELVSTTAQRFNVEHLSTDKGYSSHGNIEAINYLGATPYIAFKDNAVGNSKLPLWNKACRYFPMNRDEFLTRYHRRSDVESTFSAMKRKFGDTIRSRMHVAQRNRLLLKVLCHNIVCLIHEIHESVATPMFPALTAGVSLKEPIYATVNFRSPRADCQRDGIRSAITATNPA